jgi:hypothetical protein
MRTPKLYNHFKVKFNKELAIILQSENPITLKEAKGKCKEFYGHSNGFCVGLTSAQTCRLLEIGLHLFTFKNIDKSKIITLICPFDDVKTEDGGCAKIATLLDEADNEDDGIYARIVSWSEKKDHSLFDSFIGKKVEITIKEVTY